MKRIFEHIATGKKVDIVFQCIMFVIAIFLVVHNGVSSESLFGLYVMGLAQLLSSVFWLIYFVASDVPMIKGGIGYRKTLIIVSLSLGILLIVNVLAFALFSFTMLLIGPILGVNYFLLTIDELKYYSRARKPYYLL